MEKVETDKNGYLLHFENWNKEIAAQIAKQENITLTQEHWELIVFIRDFYVEFNTSPAIRLLVKAIQKQWGDEKGNSRYLYRLFPDGPAKQLTKIAGLPKPVKCI